MKYTYQSFYSGLSRKLFCFTAVLCMLLGCKQQPLQKFPTPKEYDLNHPYKIPLSPQLDEISGIVFYPKDTSVFSIVDEEGWLYKSFLKNGLIQKWKFGKNGDYEDLQLIDSTFYVLKSNGDITRVKFSSADSLQSDVFPFPDAGKNEFESMYYDKETGNIQLLCKDCASDKKAALSIWSFNIPTGVFTLSAAFIDVAPIAKTLGENKIRFKPSASAIHPITGEVYMVSAVNKVLVVADKTGVVTAVYPLNPSLYAQPEGISFTPTGDLLISNEISNSNNASILIFKNKSIQK